MIKLSPKDDGYFNTQVRPTEIVMDPVDGLIFLDEKCLEDEFAIMLWPGTALRFVCLEGDPKCFEAKEVLHVDSLTRHLPVLAKGVLACHPFDHVGAQRIQDVQQKIVVKRFHCPSPRLVSVQEPPSYRRRTPSILLWKFRCEDNRIPHHHAPCV